MGDNAKVNWEWHNNEVGKGYKARGVIRQPGMNENINVIDKSKLSTFGTLSNDSVFAERIESDSNRKDDKKHKKKDDKHIKSSKKRKDKKKSKSSKSKSIKNTEKLFNPILQYFASSISDSTREFS